MSERADPLETRAALDLVAHDRMVLSEGRGDDPVRGAENRDHRRADGVRDVHRPGVVRDEELAAADRGRELHHARPTGDADAADAIGDLLAELGLGGASDDDELAAPRELL